MILVLCDLRADELSRICPVILSPSPLAPHLHCYRSIKHLITALHLQNKARHIVQDYFNAKCRFLSETFQT